MRNRRRAILIGQKKYSGCIRALQAIVHAHPAARLRCTINSRAPLLRMGRLDEAIRAFDTVASCGPTPPAGALALADALIACRSHGDGA
jgi:hypothetical protein